MSEYKLNFQGLSKFIDDFSYLSKKGGNSIVGGSGFVQNLILVKDIVVAVLILAVLIFIIYTIYIIIFRGYPRWFFNLITFTFFHKEDINKILKENLVISNINIILNSKKESPIYSTILELDSNIKKYYNLIPNADKKYQEALKEYYLFYHKIQDKTPVDIVPDFNNVDKNNHPIHHKVPYAAFYTTLMNLEIENGKLNTKNPGTKPGNKGEDQLLWETYSKDKQTKNGYFIRIFTIHSLFKELSNNLNTLTQQFKDFPLISYIFLPEKQKDIDDVSRQLSDKLTEIKNGNIYNHSSTYLKNEYSWYITEILSFMYNPEYYKIIKQKLDNLTPFYNKEEIDTLRYYINLTKDKRSDVETKILNRKFEKKEPGWADFGQNNEEEKYDNKTTIEFLDFIRKYPILCNLYFSGTNIDERYSQVINTYIGFFNNATNIKEMLTNLNYNGVIFKNYVNAVNLLDLHFNNYQSQITKILEDQVVNPKEFFHKLFTPYFDDIVKNRMGSYYKKVFSSYTWKLSYNNFRVWWKSLGDALKNLIKSIWKSFFTSNTAENPQATDMGSADD
jgi:hypothetical protein